MELFLILGFAVLLLAYSNGANDNFKGVATLFGSDTTNYRSAIGWATATTLAGSVCSLLLARGLMRAFSGKGLVPDAVVQLPEFLAAVAVGAALTVLLATLTGLPISTTHSLLGGLAGAGLAASGAQLRLGQLLNTFIIPLLFSPLVAVLLTGVAYRFLRYWRLRLGVTEAWVLQLHYGGEAEAVPLATPTYRENILKTSAEGVKPPLRYNRQYTGSMLGIPVQTILDKAHFLSAGVVSFARGLNDTPKIAAMLLMVKCLDVAWGTALVGVCMAGGGLLNARKVAQTMSKRITPMNHGQGFTANAVTGVLVIAASWFGLPVSTTHVSVGAVSGIGTFSGTLNVPTFRSILLAWVFTLPTAALLAATTFLLIQ